jgi:hypothetical protein
MRVSGRYEPPPEMDVDDWVSRIVPAETMENVQDYIPLIPEVLAFGGPLKQKLVEALARAKVDCVVDLTDSTTDVPWYVEHLPPTTEVHRQFKLEGSRAEDDELDEVKLMEAARFVKMQCQGGKRRVYVFGRECTRNACIVALVAWVLETNEKTTDPVDYLLKDVLRGIPWITRDFPASSKHTDVIRKLVQKHRQSVEARFPGLTATKRQRIKK